VPADDLLRVDRPLFGIYGGGDSFPYETSAVSANEYAFPFIQVDALSNPDGIIWPLCDQAHQMFGREGSTSFSTEGLWTGRYA